jgi:ABC-type nickel/cobalt efflux system permease component RcnA
VSRLLVALVFAALALPAVASAHPLGNFTTNHFTRIEVAGDRVYVTYVLDLAEIPTFQERARVDRLGQAAYGRRLAADIGSQLTLTVGGRPVALHRLDQEVGFPRGAAGLRTTRLEALYATASLRHAPVRIAYTDATFPGRLGWREVVVQARDGAQLTSSSAPDKSASDELRAYPKDLLSDPLDVRTAALAVDPGTSPGDPPALSTGAVDAAAHVKGATETGFASLISQRDLGAGVIALSLLIALFWGAAHALTPGHGKAIVAAYMVGSRGTARHALLLGLTVTVTHTAGVFALGLVTLGLSEFIVPEDLYPWLNFVSALLVVGVGVAVLRTRVRSARTKDAHDHHHHDHAHDHDHHHHHHHGHDHDHGHSHVPAEGTGMRGLIAVGVSGGLLPCPTALVVLLAAISLHRVGFGLALIVAFSLGLAAVVSGIALLAITAKSWFKRTSFEGGLVRALPAVSAAVILVVGLAMTVRALPGVVG